MAAPRDTAARPVESFAHADTRLNIPTADAESFVSDEIAAPVTTRWPRNTALDPQLVWKGKDEQTDLLEVNTPPIFIQEKIDPGALVENLRRTAANPEDEPGATLFDSFDGLDAWESVDYYKHQTNWSNRMILGDSLAVMASLAERENLRGQVQAIYVDPPYGIKFGSNWQPRTDQRDVKDGNLADMAREAEQIKAFRDTWEHGVNSYLTYLRDRLLVARELLTESGSVFVQIGDENVHLVRSLLDETFGPENFIAEINYLTTSGRSSEYLDLVSDRLLWFGKDRSSLKYRPLLRPRSDKTISEQYNRIALPGGIHRPLAKEEKLDPSAIPNGAVRFMADNTSSSGASDVGSAPYTLDGVVYTLPPNTHWKTNRAGMDRLALAGRLVAVGKRLRYKRLETDFPWQPYTNLWDDTVISGFAAEKVYVVQTSTKVVERCLLMTTDPGDLVLDPTCGSGTTAYVAEQWGRRWITIDTSRVAVALARQRLVAAKYPYYLLADSPEGSAMERALGAHASSITSAGSGDVRQGFVYERVPHITLKSIANNPDIRKGLSAHEMDAAIARRADVELLYDRPYDDKKKVRVSGRFTVESLSPHRSVSFDDAFPDSSEPPREHLPFPADGAVADFAVDPGSSYEEIILGNLKTAGVQNGRRRERLIFTAIDPHPGRFVQAIGTAASDTDVAAARDVSTHAEPVTQRVGICLGPEYGTVDARMVKAAAREALTMPNVDVLLVLGYAFEANALDGVGDTQREGFASVAAEHTLGRLPVLLVRMNVDLAMGDELLKNSASANLFTVFGEPDIDVQVTNEGVVVEIRGIDVYDPTSGEVRSGGTDGIALWMIDTDYDEESFFVRHVYFSGGQDPYKKLKVALKTDIDEEAWESVYGTVSRPFPVPSTGKIAVKAINYYGDEVLIVREVGARSAH